jgi:hypothetical protein
MTLAPTASARAASTCTSPKATSSSMSPLPRKSFKGEQPAPPCRTLTALPLGGPSKGRSLPLSPDSDSHVRGAPSQVRSWRLAHSGRAAPRLPWAVARRGVGWWARVGRAMRRALRGHAHARPRAHAPSRLMHTPAETSGHATTPRQAGWGPEGHSSQVSKSLVGHPASAGGRSRLTGHHVKGRWPITYSSLIRDHQMAHDSEPEQCRGGVCIRLH